MKTCKHWGLCRVDHQAINHGFGNASGCFPASLVQPIGQKKSSLSALLRELRTDSSVSYMGRWHSLGVPSLDRSCPARSYIHWIVYFQVCIYGVVQKCTWRCFKFKIQLYTHVNNMNDYWMLNWWRMMHICVLFRVWYAFVCSYPWASSCNKKGRGKVVETWKVCALGGSQWSGPRSPCLQCASDRGGWRDASCPESQKLITETRRHLRQQHRDPRDIAEFTT